jgi:hypothetical protein
MSAAEGGFIEMRRPSTLLLTIPMLVATGLPVAAQSPTTTETLLSGMVTDRQSDGGWHEVTVDALSGDPWTPGIEVGADGSVWLAGVEPLMFDGEPVADAWGNTIAGDSFLMRFDGSEWQRWGETDGVPPLSGGYEVGLRQAPDGGLWMAQEHIARFDGSTWQQFLPDHFVVGWWDVAPDGAVWLKADGEDGTDLFVITPEAVTATE